MKGNRRDPSKGCRYEDDKCDFPGAKTKQPVECIDSADSDDNLFPLIFDGETISTTDNIEDGTELPALPTMVSSDADEEDLRLRDDDDDGGNDGDDDDDDDEGIPLKGSSIIMKGSNCSSTCPAVQSECSNDSATSLLLLDDMVSSRTKSRPPSMLVG